MTTIHYACEAEAGINTTYSGIKEIFTKNIAVRISVGQLVFYKR